MRRRSTHGRPHLPSRPASVSTGQDSCRRPDKVIVVSHQVDADGSIRLEWEAAETGWLTLTVDGSGQVRHSAVIGEDEFERSEAFGDVLPEWATTVLERIVRVGH